MEETLPAVSNGSELAIKAASIFLDMQRFADAQRVATLLASSTLVPEQFQRNVANCVIALNLADRLRVDTFMMMQNMYVVHGRPGIESKMAIALVEGSGRFSAIKYRMTGKGKTEKNVSRPDECVAYATEIKTGEVVEGPPVTWEMAVAEGWTKAKKDIPSKWQTMPEIMFRYRAAMFFARVHAPGALLGLRTVDELEDIQVVEMKPARNGQYASEEAPPPIQEFTIPEGTDTGLLHLFLAKTAESNKTTIEAVKLEAAKSDKDLASFWKFFAAWQKQQKAKETTNGNGTAQESTTEKETRFSCPNGGFVTLAICGDCKEREPKEGDICPSYESNKR